MGGALTKKQLASLWTQAGGDPSAANLMAQIGVDQSGGDPTSINNDAYTPAQLQSMGYPVPSYGEHSFSAEQAQFPNEKISPEYSEGIWQENFDGGAGSSSGYTPAELYNNPQLQAQAAVAAYNGAGGASGPWAGDPALTGYTSTGASGSGSTSPAQSLGSVSVGSGSLALPTWGPSWAPWNWASDAGNATIKLIFPFVCIFFGIALVVVGLDMTFKGGMIAKLQLPAGFGGSTSKPAPASGDTDAAHAAGYQQGQREVHATQNAGRPATGPREHHAIESDAGDFAEVAAA
jgi:hypothetical protein